MGLRDHGHRATIDLAVWELTTTVNELDGGTQGAFGKSCSCQVLVRPETRLGECSCEVLRSHVRPFHSRVITRCDAAEEVAMSLTFACGYGAEFPAS